MNDFIVTIIDGHLQAVEWIAKNPAKTLWSAFAFIVVLAVL